MGVYNPKLYIMKVVEHQSVAVSLRVWYLIVRRLPTDSDGGLPRSYDGIMQFQGYFPMMYVICLYICFDNVDQVRATWLSLQWPLTLPWLWNCFICSTSVEEFIFPCIVLLTLNSNIAAVAFIFYSDSDIETKSREWILINQCYCCN